MNKKRMLLPALMLGFIVTNAQRGSEAGNWNTWFIRSGKDFRLTAPGNPETEIPGILNMQATQTSLQSVQYWNAGSPGYRWYEMMNKLWVTDTGRYGALTNLLLHTAIYDATVAAWHNKYTYNRSRPFVADKRVACLVPKPESPSYPCEYSVAAGVAVTVFSKFYPALADSVQRMAKALMDARVVAGAAYPSDTRAGFDLGKQIAEKEIAATRDFVNKEAWDGNIPAGPQRWKGPFAMLPMAGKNKTVVLTGSSQFRPGPPPDFTREMQELKNFKPGFRSISNAFYWANQDYWTDQLNKKIFENNLHLYPPLAEKMYAIVAVGMYDGFTACWDAKYTYWGIRPNQFDTSYRPPIFMTPPFPGYPSGHAVISAVLSEIMSWFFPGDAELYRQKAKEAAESRFQAGIHFRTDNEAGLEMGRKTALFIIRQLQETGDENAVRLLK